MRKTILTKKYLKTVVASTKQRMEATAEQYGLPPTDIPDRNWAKLELVMTATTHEEAASLAHRAWDSLFICVLSMWAKKKIPGPTTPESLEKRARKADSLASMQFKLGNDEAAEKQRIRAAELRREAHALQGNP